MLTAPNGGYFRQRAGWLPCVRLVKTAHAYTFCEVSSRGIWYGAESQEESP